MKKKGIVFIAAGLGDAILLFPLLRRLEKNNVALTAFLDSPYLDEAFLSQSRRVSDVWAWAGFFKDTWRLFASFRIYDEAYLNVFVQKRRHIFMALWLAKSVTCAYLPWGLRWLRFFLRFVKPESGIHDAQQHLRLLSSSVSDMTLCREDFLCPLGQAHSPSFTLPPGSFVLLQMATGDARITYKNWPLTYWRDLLDALHGRLPNTHFVLLGGTESMGMSDAILPKPYLSSLVGQTNLLDVAALLRQAKAFLGLDGGLMHLAVSVGCPTFTLWGPSNPALYGYATMFPDQHRLAVQRLDCQHCYAWIDANSSRVSDPGHCPDYACMTGLLPATILDDVVTFLTDKGLS